MVEAEAAEVGARLGSEDAPLPRRLLQLRPQPLVEAVGGDVARLGRDRHRGDELADALAKLGDLGRDLEVDHYAPAGSATHTWRCRPRPSISISTTSPACRYG